MENLITTADVATILGLKEQTVRKWITQKRLPFPLIRINRKSIRFLRADVEAFIASRRERVEDRP